MDTFRLVLISVIIGFLHIGLMVNNFTDDLSSTQAQLVNEFNEESETFTEQQQSDFEKSSGSLFGMSKALSGLFKGIRNIVWVPSSSTAPAKYKLLYGLLNTTVALINTIIVFLIFWTIKNKRSS